MHRLLSQPARVSQRSEKKGFPRTTGCVNHVPSTHSTSAGARAHLETCVPMSVYVTVCLFVGDVCQTEQFARPGASLSKPAGPIINIINIIEMR
jgi:hypothetical protein